MVVLSDENLSGPKPGHTTGESGRHGAGRTAGQGDAGLNRVPTFRWPWKPTTPLARQRNVDNCFERFFANTHTRTKENLFEPLKEQNVRLTCCLTPVYNRDCKRSPLLAVDHCTDAYCLCKTFSCKACPGIALCFRVVDQ